MSGSTGDDSSIWTSLEAAARALSSSGGADRLEVRRVAGPSAVPLFRAVGVSDLRRRLLIQLPDSLSWRPRDLPSWRGLTVRDERPENVAGIKSGRFLILEQSLPGTETVYEALIAGVCACLMPGVAEGGLIPALARELDRWRAFFDRHGIEGLSPEAQRGLYGELWFISDHLIARFGEDRAIRAWAGPAGAPHDFQLGPGAVEFKTTITKQHLLVHIANELQLDDAGLGALYLVVLAINQLEAGGETLPHVIERVRGALASSPAALGAFEERLRSAGYLDAHSSQYTSGYVFRSLHAYRVGPGFPRLVGGDLPAGVGDLRYSVALSACTAFECLVDEVVRDLDERWV